MIRRNDRRRPRTAGYDITSRAQLLAVLADSGSSGTKRLAPGNYGDLGAGRDTPLTLPAFASPLRLVGGTFGAIDIKGFSNLALDGIEASNVGVSDASYFELANSYVHEGDYLVSVSDNTRTTTNITIRGNTITRAGVDCLRVATGSGNSSGYITDVLIEGNYVSDAGYLGYSHPDALQAWNYCYTGTPGVFSLGRCGINNLTIRGNVVLGDQDGPQGFFLNNEGASVAQIHAEGPVSATMTRNGGPGVWTTISASVTFSTPDVWTSRITAAAAGTFSAVNKHDLFTVTGTSQNNLQFIATADGGSGTTLDVRRYNLRHSNFLIENNFCYINSPHGFTNTYVDGLTVRNNIVLGACRDVPGGRRVMSIIAQSWCRNVSIAADNVLVANPTSSDTYVGTGSGVANPTMLMDQNDPASANHIGKHFANPARRFSPVADDFQVLGTSSLYSHPACVAYRALRPAPTLYVKATQTQDMASLTVSVAAVKIADDGVLAGCTYAWDWGDGTAAGSGQSTSHAYQYQGEYAVTCSVTGAVTQTIEKILVVRDPLVAYLTLADDLTDLGWDNLGWSGYNGPNEYAATVDFSGDGIEIGADKSQVVTRADNSRLASGMDEITVSLEFYQAANDAFGIILGNGAFGLNAYADALSFSIGSDSALHAHSYNDGTWRRVTGTFKSSTGAIRLYIDNSLVASGTHSGRVATSNTPLKFGYAFSGNDFGGRIRNVVILAGVPTITGDAAKTAIEAVIAARAYPWAMPTAAAKAVTMARSTTTSFDPNVGATGGPWMPRWIAFGSWGYGEVGGAEDGLAHLSAGSNAGESSLTYQIRNRYLRDTAPATITVTIT